MGNNKWKECVGKRFGRYVILNKDFSKKSKRTYCICLCDCGNQKSVLLQNLLNGNTKSCGCYNIEEKKEKKTTHTYSRTRIYRIFQFMKQRCYNPQNDRYSNYGARGIQICKDWLNDFSVFYQWAINNGYSDELTIDRINNDGNYEPQNCRWTNRLEQANNRTNNHWVVYNGEKLTLKQLSRKYNINVDTLSYRLKHWDIDKAINKPIQGGHQKCKRFTTLD